MVLHRRQHQNRIVGETHHKARLTDAQVREIRERYQPRKWGCGCQSLAREYGCSPQTVWNIVNYATRWGA